jgi:hypothetical protein
VAAAAGVTLAVAVLAGAGGARAASGQPASAAAHPALLATGYQVKGKLFGVVATSRGNAWAVGMRKSSAGVPMTLLLHWNGTKWTPVTSPKPVPGELTAVAATSAGNAWAVGQTGTPKGPPTSYVLHWNGKAWSVQHCPVPMRYAYYTGVAASGSDAWITGRSTGPPNVQQPAGLIEHRTGGTWQSVTFPGAVQTTLYSVAFSGKQTAWAAGASGRGGVLLHWTGSQWKIAGRFFDPVPEAVATGPGGQAWLVGHDPAGASGDGGYSEHWNGKTWRYVAVPRQGSELLGVAYFPGGTVWAVGLKSGRDTRIIAPFIVRWTGKAWTQVPAPGGRQLQAVAGDAANDGWAVGGDGTTTTILHWNGKSWS